MKKICFLGAIIFLILPTGQAIAQTDFLLTVFFENAVGLQDRIAHMEGDTVNGVHFEKGTLWYRVTLIEDSVTVMWSSNVGRIWLPAGNVTFLAKKNGEWTLSVRDDMEVSPQYLQELIKKIKKFKAGNE